MRLSSLIMHCLWTLFTAAPLLHGQNMLDGQGLKTGPWKVDFPNGGTQYEATFRQGKPVGEMVRYYENGAIRAIMVFDTVVERNYASLYYQNGGLAAEGWFVQRVKDSVWTYYSEFDGSVRIREPYKSGKLQGTERKYYPGGTVSEEVQWDQHRKSGPWRRYYQDGSLRLESSYFNDKLNGAYEVYGADRTIRIRGTYTDNLSNGTWSYYDESGNVAYTIEFVNGVAVDQEKYRQIVQDSLKRFEMLPEPESQQQF